MSQLILYVFKFKLFIYFIDYIYVLKIYEYIKNKIKMNYSFPLIHLFEYNVHEYIKNKIKMHYLFYLIFHFTVYCAIFFKFSYPFRTQLNYFMMVKKTILNIHHFPHHTHTRFFLNVLLMRHTSLIFFFFLVLTSLYSCHIF
jgi:hypothetical protein